MNKPIDILKSKGFESHLSFLMKTREDHKDEYDFHHLMHYMPTYLLEMDTQHSHIESLNYQVKTGILNNDGFRLYRSTQLKHDRSFIPMDLGFFDKNRTKRQFKENLFKLVNNYVCHGASNVTVQIREPNLAYVQENKSVFFPDQKAIEEKEFPLHLAYTELKESYTSMQNIFGDFSDVSLEHALECVNRGKKNLEEKVLPFYDVAKKYHETLDAYLSQTNRSGILYKNPQPKIIYK